MNITIKPELKALIPPLAEDERKQLEQNLIADGCREPLVVWKNRSGDVLLDGHNRHEICERNNIPFEVTHKEFDAEVDARVWMRENQMGRRNLNGPWRIKLQDDNSEDLYKKGLDKLSSINTGNTNASKTTLSTVDKVVSQSPSVPTINTRTEIAKAAGVSPRQVGEYGVVKKKSPELLEKALNGDITLHSAYEEIRKEEKKADRIALIEKQKRDIESGEVQMPEGVFEVIALDPPWNYGREYDPETSRVANPYPEMTQAQLLELEPPFADDSVCMLWTTHAFLFDAKELLDHWGFDYKATMVWDKARMGMGAWLRMQCEFCLVGIKGKPNWNNTKWRDIINEPRREHSRKPDAFYEMVEDVVAGRRLEFFSREQRKGWTTYGNDTDKF